MMKRRLPKRRLLNAVLACVVLAPCVARAADSRAADSRIRLNTVGFLPAHSKRASVAARFRNFSVVEEGRRSRAVFRGRASGPFHNEDTNEDLYVADFSALRRPGLYRLEVEGVGSSPPFRVARDV
jgi:endoglucanase